MMTNSDLESDAPRRPRILLTGFGPFPTVADNASARLVAALTPLARARFPGVEIESEVLPTEWRAGPERLAALISFHDPDVIISFGVAHDATGFRLETQALNVCRLAPDAAGLEPLEPVLRGDGPEAHAGTGPISAIADRLSTRGYPVSISNDAGGYLCNAAFYHALDCAAGASAPRTIAFVHIPADLSIPPMTLDGAVAGALEIVNVCLAAARTR
jgi:pyroglutamyl-peptidase